MADDVAYLAIDDELAVRVTEALQQGDLATLDELLAAHPELTRVRLGSTEQSRTLLHVVTDWPGHFAQGPSALARLVAAEILLAHGADPTWVGWDDLTPLALAHQSTNGPLVTWLESVLAARQGDQ
jgi:hypothetical protein